MGTQELSKSGGRGRAGNHIQLVRSGKNFWKRRKLEFGQALKREGSHRQTGQRTKADSFLLLAKLQTVILNGF